METGISAIWELGEDAEGDENVGYGRSCAASIRSSDVLSKLSVPWNIPGPTWFVRTYVCIKNVWKAYLSSMPWYLEVTGLVRHAG